MALFGFHQGGWSAGEGAWDGDGVAEAGAEGVLFVAADRLPRAAGHPLYERLNRLLVEARFNDWIGNVCPLAMRRTAWPGDRLSLRTSTQLQ